MVLVNFKLFKNPNIILTLFSYLLDKTSTEEKKSLDNKISKTKQVFRTTY